MKLNYAIYGEGPPLLLLHGFPLDHSSWDLMIPYFQENIKLILPDLRGFGKSSQIISRFSISDMAQDVIQILDNLEIQKVIIAGHSMGGYVSLEIGKNIPDRLCGIILVASHIYADSEEKQHQRLATIQRLKSEKPENVFADMPEKLSKDKKIADYCRQTLRNANPLGLQGALFAMAGRPSSEAFWEESSLPKLLLAGDDDGFISKKKYENMVNSGNNVVYTVFQNCGHMLMRKKPGKTAAAIEKFINSLRST